MLHGCHSAPGLAMLPAHWDAMRKGWLVDSVQMYLPERMEGWGLALLLVVEALARYRAKLVAWTPATCTHCGCTPAESKETDVTVTMCGTDTARSTQTYPQITCQRSCFVPVLHTAPTRSVVPPLVAITSTSRIMYAALSLHGAERVSCLMSLVLGSSYIFLRR